ncbi:MAG: endonuclease/exonuclease/phosphatase family protein [Spirochaetales bacterium]|nr:endonuclease/exonuclease/phosphatase family protein [Spirochaetales bacterium]
MVPHSREFPTFNYNFDREASALKSTKQLRTIPSKSSKTLLAATWNLTNLGCQDRSPDDFRLIAEVIGWFDLIAIQEISEDLDHLRYLMGLLPASYSFVISDIGGNRERAGFIYDSDKIQRLELSAEVAIPPGDHRYIRLKGVSGSFTGFDRNPYVTAFEAGELEFMAASVHLFYGSTSCRDEDRRALEAYGLARWASQRMKSKGSYSQNILLLGDFNLPSLDSSSNVYRALKAKGLMLPEHSTSIGSNLHGDKHYDQISFHMGRMESYYTGKSGVFDFDHEPFFEEAWKIGREYFDDAVKYHIADHRPVWIEFEV